ncbi:MAG: secretin N-terminal domain-containing protein [Planctomycetota bacterium]
MRSSMKSREFKFLVVLAFVMAACAVTIAENTVAENGSEDLENLMDKEILTGLEQRMLKRISIDFRNTPIEDVIRIMAEQADVDIIKSPKVIGNVTATLTNVPLEEALDNILASHSYGYVTGKNMIRIAPLDEIAQKAESLDSKIYHITYADVEQVEKALEKFVSKRGSLSANKGTSHIIVTDTESNIKAIDTFIGEVDRITPQILVEVRIYDIISRDRFDLGILWQAGQNTDFSAGGIGNNPTGETSPFSTGTWLTETAKTADTTIGALRFGWLNSNLDIDILLRAEQENVDAKLLANPRILVLDNEKALFDIVTEHPYIERTISGETIVETVKFKEVGVKLQVKPHVTRDGMVRLHIIPEFGVVVQAASAETSNVPVVDTRTVNTIALVESGQTVVLGGLRKKDVSKQVDKVPLLGDLPLIGGLFRFTAEDTAVNELVVFITPQIIEEPLLSENEKRAYEVTEFKGPKVALTEAEKKESEE